MRNFHLDSIEGKRCYEVLHGRSEPCPFCGEHFTDYDNIVTWENTNPITGRHYLLKDRLIEWNDRPARLEIAFDVTEAEKEKQSLKFALRAEDMLVDCVRSLYEDRGIGEILPVILDKLGRFMNADRSYVFMLRDGKLYNEYEWCAEGVESQMDTLQGLPLEFIDRWLKIFDRQECMVLEDVQDLKENYRNEYEILTAQGITSLVAAPLERDGHFCGAIGVDNPPLEQLVNIGPLLRTLGYFLMLSYRRDENEKELNRLSYHDTLTSFYNRNRYTADTDNLRVTDSPVGIVYLDVNGLKDINDLRGHAFGDKVLVECARRMRETFDGADFYRIGGDEFVIICREWSKEVFEEKVELLRKNFERDSICRAAVGSRWAEGSDDLSQIIADADARMYEDKKEFYRRSPVSRRYRHQSDEVINLSNPEVLADELGKNHFVVYVQPKVSSADRSAVGAEALIRYQSKEGSMVLPGNEILPFAGLMSASLALPAFLVTRGNLLQMSILCVIGAPVFLWVGTAFAPFMTELAIATGSIDLQAGELISNSLINGPVFTYSISHLFMFLKGNFMPLIIFAVWLAGFILYYRDLMREAREDAALEAGNAKAGQ